MQFLLRHTGSLPTPTFERVRSGDIAEHSPRAAVVLPPVGLRFGTSKEADWLGSLGLGLAVIPRQVVDVSLRR